MSYRIYYDLYSPRNYLSYSDAVVQSDLSGLIELLEMIKAEGDSVYVYLPTKRNRIEFSYANERNLIFELHDSLAAGVHSKLYEVADLQKVVDSVPDVIANPKAAGFSFKHW